MKWLNIITFLVLMSLSAHGEADLDTTRQSKKNAFKAIGIAWPQGGAFTVGHEFMFSDRVSGEYLYSLSTTAGDNSWANESFRVGIKYYLRNQKRKILNNCYGGLYGKYREKHTSLDQDEIDRINYRILGGGISLGKMMYITNWLTLEIGYSAMMGKENAAVYYHTNVHYHRLVWKIFHGPTFLIGISF